jgi:hypothetical protein
MLVTEDGSARVDYCFEDHTKHRIFPFPFFFFLLFLLFLLFISGDNLVAKNLAQSHVSQVNFEFRLIARTWKR